MLQKFPSIAKKHEVSSEVIFKKATGSNQAPQLSCNIREVEIGDEVLVSKDIDYLVWPTLCKRIELVIINSLVSAPSLFRRAFPNPLAPPHTR